MEKNEGNKLIAEFMGWQKHTHTEMVDVYLFPNLYPIYNINDKRNSGWTSAYISEAKFHDDWSWLMPVVEKIENMKDDEHCYRFAFRIGRDFCVIEYNSFNPQAICAYSENGNKILSVWNAIIKFIQWYNKQNSREG
jgi:hypothetical protein